MLSLNFCFNSHPELSSGFIDSAVEVASSRDGKTRTLLFADWITCSALSCCKFEQKRLCDTEG